MIADSDCTGEALAAAIASYLEDGARLSAMSVAARSLGHPDAADRVAGLAEEFASRRPSRRSP
jgi:UDP-N-acetylglucosamine:LPS N-acetylglucosamine transferase